VLHCVPNGATGAPAGKGAGFIFEEKVPEEKVPEEKVSGLFSEAENKPDTFSQTPFHIS
jgi:hypothetical protein